MLHRMGCFHSGIQVRVFKLLLFELLSSDTKACTTYVSRETPTPPTKFATVSYRYFKNSLRNTQPAYISWNKCLCCWGGGSDKNKFPGMCCLSVCAASPDSNFWKISLQISSQYMETQCKILSRFGPSHELSSFLLPLLPTASILAVPSRGSPSFLNTCLVIQKINELTSRVTWQTKFLSFESGSHHISMNFMRYQI